MAIIAATRGSTWRQSGGHLGRDRGAGHGDLRRLAGDEVICFQPLYDACAPDPPGRRRAEVRAPAAGMEEIDRAAALEATVSNRRAC